MPDKPSISLRKSIKWGDQPAAENTSTLVLTSARKYFVDTRFFLPLSENKLEWAFAGSSFHTPASSSQTETSKPEASKPAHTTWSHWVDSKVGIRRAEEVRDEGDMYVLGNGDVLERGSMFNESSGRVEGYEEVWGDLGVGAVEGEQGDGEGEGEGEEEEEPGEEGEELGVEWEEQVEQEGERKRSWVLRTEKNIDDEVSSDEGKDGDGGMREERVKGMMIRVGEWIQGVVRRGDKVGVVRWMWSKDEGWKVVAAIGELDVPSVLRSEGDVKPGYKFLGEDGFLWECVESCSWRS